MNKKAIVIISILLVLLCGLLFFITRVYNSPIIAQDGYFISKSKIDKELGSGVNKIKTRSIKLEKISKEDTVYSTLGKSYVSSDTDKKEINTNYPIYSNNGLEIININANNKLLNKHFKEFDIYENCIIVNKTLYNYEDREQADYEEYILLKNDNGTYINLTKIEINNGTKKLIIPVNSIISFSDNYIKYFSYNKAKKLELNVIPAISNYDKIIIEEKKYNYEDFINLLNNITKDNDDDDDSEYIIEDKDDKKNDNYKSEEDIGYVKPVVKVDNFKPNIYTATSNLRISDPSKVIIGGINFQVYIDDKPFLRKVFISSGQIQIRVLKPNTNYHIEGNYKYYDEQNNKIEVSFFKQDLSTGDYRQLEPINLSFQNGDIYSNKIEINDLKIISNIDDELKYGISKGFILINDSQYTISSEIISNLIKGKTTSYTSPESLKSNENQSYEIYFKDAFNNLLNITNNKGTTRTSKESPSVNIKILRREVNKTSIQVTLKNKDKVNINSYKYVIYSNNTPVYEGNLDQTETENVIEQKQLNPNETFKIVVYGNYDKLDGKGTVKNVPLGETKFTTLSLSALGYLKMKTTINDVSNHSASVSCSIDSDNISPILLELLSEVKLSVKDSNGKVVYTKTYKNGMLENISNGRKDYLDIIGLKSKTTYTIEYEAKAKMGTEEGKIKVTSGISTFKTYKEDAYISVINQFITNDIIDFDVCVIDNDGAISSKRVILEVRDDNDNLVEIRDLEINGDYVQIKYNHLTENKEYKFKYYVEGYNIGYNNATFENDYVLKEEYLITEASIVGNLELYDISSEILSNNLFNIKDFDRIRKTGSTGYKEYDVQNNAIMFGAKNGYTNFSYYLPEAEGKRVKVKFLAKYSNKNEYNCNIYINNSYERPSSATGRTNDNGIYKKKLAGLTTEYKEYTYELYLINGYLAFEIDSPSSKNQRTDIWIKDLSIIEISEDKNLSSSYSNYTDSSNKSYIFSKTEMKSGRDYIKSYEDETEYVIGNSKDGHAIIKGISTTNDIKEHFYQKNQQQEFVVPENGTYKIELWGAAGGNNTEENNPANVRKGGKGAYTSGEIYLRKDTILYFYVGSKGADAVPGQDSAGGYNGGGMGAWDHQPSEGLSGEADGAGGGATDVRLVPGVWNNENSLKSRIMVAGGGGGASMRNNGGDAGGLSSFVTNASPPATQISGYKLGIGEPGRLAKTNNPTAGGGGGYYGGYSTYSNTEENPNNGYYNPGSGGSSYISGHNGCVSIAISESRFQDAKNIIIDSNNNKSDKYKENSKYAANLSVSLIDKKKSVSDKKYYIKIYKEDKLVETNEYSFVDYKIINNIKRYYLDKNKNYTIVLSIKIRDREYDIDELEIKTNTEIRQIKTETELFNIHPNGKYVVVNDLDLKSINKYIYDFYGEIDFQGHNIELNFDNRLYFIRYLRSGGVVKNIVVNYYEDNTSSKSWTSPFIYVNYGTIDNIIFNIKGTSEKLNTAYGLCTYSNRGIIKNFIVNAESTIYVKDRFGYMTYVNYGNIENGYTYGKNITATRDSLVSKDIGCIAGQNNNNSVIKNVLVLNNVDRNPNADTDKYIGNIVGYAYLGRIENSISVESEDDINKVDNDPNIGRINNQKTNKLFYVSPRTYETAKSTKASFNVLRDVNFLDKLLNNGKDIYDVEKYVKLGYYPQLKLNSCMPNQKWIQLPKTTENDSIEITSIEEEKIETSSAIIKINMNNPTEETIRSIGVKSIDKIEILSQENDNGKSVVRVKLSEPKEYKSKYYLKKISAETNYGYQHDITYEDGKVAIDITMYYPIKTITDWKRMSTYNTDNYILENDIDFSNAQESDIYIVKSASTAADQAFKGLLNGNNKTIKNIKLETYSSVFYRLGGNAVIKNLYVENFTKLGNSTSTGLINHVDGNVEINNVHMKNVNITASQRVGAITGYANGLILRNSSVTNLVEKISYRDLDIKVGGLVGYSYGNGYISNCYANNIDIEISDSITTYGVGGIVGHMDTGNINNTYATGKINNNSLYTGGIVGLSSGLINNCWTDVDINSRLEYVGGIVGKRDNEAISNTLVFGNIYSSTYGDNIGRTSGNSLIFPSKSYYWNGQNIHGILSYNSKGEKELTDELINKESTYYDLLNFKDNFDYSSIESGVLPKLKDTEGKLLPNQQDYKYKKELLKVKSIETNQDIEKGEATIIIDNPSKYEIKSVEFDYLEYDSKNMVIGTSTSNENETIIIIRDIRPKRYYDSYSLKAIKYSHIGETETYSLSKNSKVDFQFLKDISSVEDWQKITNTEENYRLKADLDFTGISNVNKNISIGRLEGQGHSIKNINIEGITSPTGLIKKATISIRNVTFDNITMRKSGTSSFNYVNIIEINVANLQNVTFKDITIDAQEASYVAPIGQNRAQSIRDIEIIGGNIKGKNYVGGFIAYSQVNDLYNVNANGITVTAVGNRSDGGSNVGGIVGYREYSEVNSWFSVTGKNMTVTGARHTGGLFGQGAADNSSIEDSYIYATAYDAGAYIGGIAGYNRDRYSHNNSAKRIHVIISNPTSYAKDPTYTYVGGLFGTSYDTTDVEILDSEIVNNGTRNVYTGGIQGYKGGYTNQNNYIYNTTITSQSAIGTGGIIGYSGGQGAIYYSAATEIKVSGVNNVGGGIGVGNLSRFHYATINGVEIKGSGINVGGVYGKIHSLDDVDELYSDKSSRIIVENAKVIGNDYVSLFAGSTPAELPTSFFNYIFLIGNVYSNGDNYGIEIPRDTTMNIVPRKNKNILVYQNNKYIKVGAQNIENKSLLSSYYNSEDSNKQYVTLIKNENLATESFYTNNGITTSYFNFTYTEDNKSKRYVSNGYYPIVKNNSKQTPVKYPTGTVVPEESASYMTYSVRSYGGIEENKIPKINVYSSGIDTINFEFDNYNEKINFKVYEKEELVYEGPLMEKNYTFNYNYLSDIKVVLENQSDIREYEYKAEDLQNKVTTINDKYAYIYDGELKGNIKTNNKQYIHLYGKYALTKDNEIYNIETNKKETINSKSLSKATDTNPLFEFNLSDKKIRTYYNYSIISNSNGNILYDSQLFYSNGELEIVDNNIDNIKTTAIVEHTGSKDYVTILGTDGVIYNLKDDIVFPPKFNNSNIKYMSNNINNNSNIVVVMYESGRVVVFDYHTGSEIIAEKATEKVSLLDYIKENTTNEMTSLPSISKNSYAKSLELAELLTEKPLKEEDSKKENDNSNKQYIVYYNAIKNNYDVIDKNELLNTKESNVTTENDKIYSSSDYVSFYMKDGIATETNDRISIVTLLCIILVGVIISLGLWFINNRDFKSKEMKI